jgi:hypothetical protein
MSWQQFNSYFALPLFYFQGEAPILSQIHLINNSDGDKTIKVLASSSESYGRLIQVLGTSIYYEALPDNNAVQLKTSDQRLILQFLLSLIAFDASIGAIEQSIRFTLQIPVSLQPYPIIPEWIRIGNFLFDRSNNHESNTLLRNQIYQNTRPQAVIREIQLNGHRSGRVQLVVSPAIETAIGPRSSYSAAAFDIHRLITDLQNTQPLRAAVPDAMFHEITATLSAFAISRMPPLPTAPLFFSNARPNRFALRIQQAVEAQNNANLTAGMQASLAHPIHEPLPVPESLNDKKLSEYAVKVEPTDDLCCGISGVIMDKPMHVQGIEGHYNAAHIALWMREKNKHPATGKLLVDGQQFVHDTVKQAEVDKFMETAKTAQLRRSARLSLKRKRED